MIHLGLDFDNTLICYDQLFKEIALERGLISHEIKANKNVIRDFLRQMDREDDWTRLQGEVYGKHILRAIPYSGMKQSLEFLANLNIPLTIVSHKTKKPFLGESWDLHAAASSWLNKFGMHSSLGPNISREQTFFECTKQAKCSRIISAGCTHYIDDLPEILDMLPDTIIKIHFSPDGQLSNNKWLIMHSWSQLPMLLGLLQ
jgi:hypothetical protein